MAITDLPLFSMLRTRMQWHQERQRLLAENVANADTPNYRPRDLAPPNFEPSQIARRVGVASALDAHRCRPHQPASSSRRQPVPGRALAAATRRGRAATPSTSKTR